MKVTIQTVDRELVADIWGEFQDTSDIQIEETLAKAGLDELLTIVLTVSGTITLNLLTSWLYDKLKENADQKTVINGTQIHIEKIEIGQFTQIVNGEQHHSHADGRTGSIMADSKKE